MAVPHLSVWLLNVHVRVPLRKVSVRSMQHVLVALLSDEASSYSRSCNFTIRIPLAALDPRARCAARRYLPLILCNLKKVIAFVLVTSFSKLTFITY